MGLQIQSAATATEEVKQEINEDINAFVVWFRENVEDTPLMRAEEAILRTYLQWKLLKKE